MKPEVDRRRMIREAVLQCLWVADGSDRKFGLTFDQIYNGFTRSRLRVGAAELQRELEDLAQSKLAVAEFDEAMKDFCIKITPRGRDFKTSGYPWEKLDDFSGDQSLARG